MIKSGFAWVYDRYVKDSSLYKYQDQAKAENLGLWRAKDPIAPWVWRKQNELNCSHAYISSQIIIQITCKHYFQHGLWVIEQY